MIATKDELLALLDLERFAGWLDAQPKDAIVGRVYEADGCPLARYLTDGEDAPLFARVDGVRITVTTADADIAVPAPRWAARFIADVDSGSPEPDITAWYAEYVLLHIRREVAQ